jgi:hypothetical protein
MFKKLITHLPCDPAISLLKIYPGDQHQSAWKYVCAKLLIAACLLWQKQSKFPYVREWLNTLCIVYLHNGGYRMAVKTNEDLYKWFLGYSKWMLSEMKWKMNIVLKNTIFFT